MGEERSSGKREIEQLFDRVMESCLAMFPKGMIEHLGNSQKEILLALRSIVDNAIERTEERISRVKEKK